MTEQLPDMREAPPEGRSTGVMADETDPRPAPTPGGQRKYPRGAIVAVDHGGRFEARIVAVIGVVAVVAPAPEPSAGEACRAVPVRCCRPVGDEPPSAGAGRGPR